MSINDVNIGSKNAYFETSYSGFIGYAPFKESSKEKNFMWQLKNKGLIDHMTVSFYMEDDDKDTENAKSIIKFGGIDKEGLQEDSN